MNDDVKHPPAFPAAQANGPDSGMTLRDYFAAAALQGYLSGALRPGMSKPGESTHQDFASAAYNLADTMLKARITE